MKKVKPMLRDEPPMSTVDGLMQVGRVRMAHEDRDPQKGDQETISIADDPLRNDNGLDHLHPSGAPHQEETLYDQVALVAVDATYLLNSKDLRPSENKHDK